MDEVYEILGELDDHEPGKAYWGGGSYRHPYGQGDVHVSWFGFEVGETKNGYPSRIENRLCYIHDANPRYSKKYGRRDWDYENGEWILVKDKE